MTRLVVTISDDLKNALVRLAKLQKRNIAALVRGILSEYLHRQI